ncbi:helix-turn-helix domain-containing protein [Conexibacter sp. W3-3-2]|uniref:helix-turn-helix domain-containing protein n=1 Tax=Conexibacter sp. W3-3-2 TaxID=2675227 RepID=UPI0012B8DF4B|nr:AraC family transcriptional regulator [Conexibacter sp. W3-3-2]MTD45075.1 helix-turn-helix domain-containing protein [Conexibacter sp. W3-3-2]
MQVELAAPSCTLRGHVLAYAGFASRDPAPVRRAELPFGGVAVILALDGGWLIDGEAFGSFAGGLTEVPVMTENVGAAELVQIDLTPLGARALLGVPGRELTGAVVALEDLLGRELPLLVERLALTASWAARFALLDAFVARRVAAATPVGADVARAFARLHETHGALRVDALARELHCSTRHLSRRFGEAVGLPPKAYARLLRFERAAARLRAAPCDLGRVAAECGYADQAHFNRDFRTYTGTTPTALLATTPPPVRDLRSDPSKTVGPPARTVGA